MRRFLTIAAVLGLLAACAGDPAATGENDPANDPSTTGIETPHPNGDPVPLDRLGTSNLAPDVPEPEPGIRSRQRLDLDQLDRALEDATGFRWTDAGDNAMLENLSSTLGKPDYIQTTLEDLTPSLLFHKFLDDAARSVCTRLMAAEVDRAPEDRIFLVAVDPLAPLADADGTDETLSNALLRFHGRKWATDDLRLDVWRWLLGNTPASVDPLLPWTNVCVGLLTHPDFYAY